MSFVSRHPARTWHRLGFQAGPFTCFLLATARAESCGLLRRSEQLRTDLYLHPGGYMTSFPLNSGDKCVPFLLVIFSGNYFILLVSADWIECIFLTGPAKKKRSGWLSFRLHGWLFPMCKGKVNFLIFYLIWFWVLDVFSSWDVSVAHIPTPTYHLPSPLRKFLPDTNNCSSQFSHSLCDGRRCWQARHVTN